MRKTSQMILDELKEHVIQGNIEVVEKLTHDAINNQIPAYSVVSLALVPAMRIVGTRFEERDFFVPEVLMSAEAMKTAMEVLHPHLKVSGFTRRTKVVIGVIRECSQEIGKDLVATMLSGAGFEVHDLGVNVHPDRFVDVAKELGAQIIAVGSPMDYTTHYIREITERLRAENLRSKIKVLIGGAGTSSQTVDEVNADAWAENALDAVKKVEELGSE
ncbi:MAG: cobalamin-dependent protein [Candidatus Bathyarchaeota archaeon]|nr:MAG: cobalamin-dependent protein [Candidatus Bathyarchaeota archaeon]